MLLLTSLPLDCLEEICRALARGDDAASFSDPAALAHAAAACSPLRAAAHAALGRLKFLDLTPPRICAIIPRRTSSSSSPSTSTRRPPTPAELGAAGPLVAALLARCTAAVAVDLSRGHAYVSDGTLAALAAAAGPSLRSVRAAHCARLTPAGTAALSAGAPGLRELSLAAVPAAGEPGALAGFALEELDVAWVRGFGKGGGGGGGGGAAAASPSTPTHPTAGGPLCPGLLARASLRGCEGVDDALLPAILSPALTFLDLAFTAVSDAGLAAVAAGAPRLRTLVVANSEKSDNLWSYGFYSAGGLRRFRAAAPQVEVVLVAS